MKCSNCSVEIISKFAYSLKANICPACGKSIMEGDRLASYLSLKTLLDELPEKLDSDKIANLIVANFELKQLFNRGEDVKQTDVTPESTENIESVETKKKLSDKEFDEKYKAKQIEESRELLKKMRDEALNDSLRNRFGMGDIEIEDEEDDLFDDTENIIESVNRMAQTQKQTSSHSGMLSGKGGFTRSDD